MSQYVAGGNICIFVVALRQLVISAGAAQMDMPVYFVIFNASAPIQSFEVLLKVFLLRPLRLAHKSKNNGELLSWPSPVVRRLQEEGKGDSDTFVRPFYTRWDCSRTPLALPGGCVIIFGLTCVFRGDWSSPQENYRHRKTQIRLGTFPTVVARHSELSQSA